MSAKSAPISAPETAPEIEPPTVPKLRSKKLQEAVAAFALAEAEIARTKPLIIEGMGEHPLAIVGNHRVKLSRTEAVAGVPAVKITDKMVGTMIPAKKARGASVRLSVS